MINPLGTDVPLATNPLSQLNPDSTGNRSPQTAPAEHATAVRPESLAERRFYRPELDALRFFAFLCVFLFHGLPGVEVANHPGWKGLLARGYSSFRISGRFGVCLFFVLSSFLITELLLRERAATGTVHVKAFYARRILRIWPLYFSFLLVGYLLGFFVAGWRIGGPRLLAFLALLGNWYVARRGMILNPIAPLWSISIEEQFYLTWPWLAKAAGRTGIRVVSLLLLPLAWAVLVLLARIGPGASQAIWFSSIVQFEFFALGALLALLLHNRAPCWPTTTRLAFAAAAVALWTSAEAFCSLQEPLHFGPLPVLIGYQLVAGGCILSLLAFLGLPAKWIPRRLVYLGKISYGLYVFHYLSQHIVFSALDHVLSTAHGVPAVASHWLIALLASLALTVAMAALSYRFLETPFLALKERFTFVRSRAV